jgi:hypothetical protein
MKLSDLNRRYVLRHTLVPAVTAAVAVLLLAASVRLHDAQLTLFTQQTANQDALHEDYDSLVYRRRLVDRYHRRYDEFYRLGFVGRERRLDWIETLREARMDLTLPRIGYAIEPQLQAIAPVESYMASDDVQIHLSRAQLEIGLLHELDLLHFVDALQRRAPGLIRVDHCELKWQAAGTENLGIGANIHALCSLQIFSLLTSDVSQMAQLGVAR